MQRILSHEEYVLSVRLRLGASVVDSDVLCQLCGAPIDRCCHHPMSCAIGEATSGHTKVRDSVMDLVLKADATAETEPEALTSCPGLHLLTFSAQLPFVAAWLHWTWGGRCRREGCLYFH